MLCSCGRNLIGVKRKIERIRISLQHEDRERSRKLLSREVTEKIDARREIAEKQAKAARRSGVAVQESKKCRAR